MKKLNTLLVAGLALSMISCNNQGTQVKSLETEIDSVSYALGLNMSAQLKTNFEEVNKQALVRGYLNGMDSLDLLMDVKDIRTVLNTYFQKKQQEKMKEQQAAAAKRAEAEFGEVKKEGEAFLAKNKTKKGVVTTASGLQYEVIKKGKGDKPVVTSRVKVHYHGTLLDGTVFDSSVDKKKPYETGVNQVIKGWIEGLQLMSEGAKYKFYIPQELAYGATPRAGGVIKPFMPLIFEVELLKILKK